MTMMKVNQEGVLEKYEGQEAVVVVPEGVVKIGISAFYNNKSIREVVLPDSLTEIGIGSFQKSALERIVIPSGVRSIGRSAFEECTELHSVLLPDSLSDIDSYAFKHCGKLKNLTLPEGLRSIENETFCGCGIVELDIPEGVTYIRKSAFYRMESLESLRLPKTLAGIDQDVFYGCVKLKEARLPEGLMEIRRHAFGGCAALEKVTFPGTLINAERNAFEKTPMYGTKELEEVCRRANERIAYPRPRSYQELNFGGMKFFYRSEKEIYDAFRSRGTLEKQRGFVYDYSLTDSLSIYRDTEGRPVLGSYVSIPTFDFGDREWDSYARLYLGRRTGECYGIYINGGYKISKICSYRDVWYADSKTEKIMKLVETKLNSAISFG